jgi:hypothetical protein
MLDLVDASVVDTRRFCDLSLRIPLLDGLTDQAISLGIKCVFAADFVSYPSEAGQRIVVCHTISSMLRHILPVAISHPGYHSPDTQERCIAAAARPVCLMETGRQSA